jgi:hypothetical protein
MKKLVKKSVALLVGTLTLAAVAGVAQAETRFAVQDAAGTTDKMVVTDTGAIGIGTSSPVGAIHFNGNTYTSTQFVGQWYGNPVDPLNGGAGFLGFHNNAGGALPVKGDRLGYFMFGSLNGSARLVGAGLNVRAEENWTPTVFPAYMAFETTATNGRLERMKIMGSTGFVGIGIGSAVPTQRLEVNGGVKLITSAARPTCNASARGTFWVVRGGVGTADTVSVCLKGDGASTENYAWKDL